MKHRLDRKKPWLGFAGMILIVIGASVGSNCPDARLLCLHIPLIFAGLSVIAFAFITGRATMFG